MIGDHLVVVRTFSHPHEAHLAYSALDAAGIEAVVHDAHIVTANWLYSNAVGGVKLLVHPDDAVAAREILDSTAVIQKNDRPELKGVRIRSCPHCGSRNVVPVVRGKRIAFLTWLLAGMPLFRVKHEMQCEDCQKYSRSA